MCFGDSNTWGYVPGSAGVRYPFDKRWPGRLQMLLGSDYRVNEEGLNGRTAGTDDPIWPNRNGIEHLPLILETHAPIDLLIVMLGTNDIKSRFGLSPSDISRHMQALLEVTGAPDVRVAEVLLVSPPHIVPTTAPDTVSSYEGSLDKSMALAESYGKIAEQIGCHFRDAHKWASSSSIDGIHMDEDAHARIASSMCDVVREVLQ